MFKKFALSIMVLMLVFSLSGVAASVQAGIISTQDMMKNLEQEKSLERVRMLLDQEQVKNQMLAMGVAPEEVRGRLASLTGSEIAEIQRHLDTMPAGGDALAVIGVVFIVLLILELVGVTNIFTHV